MVQTGPFNALGVGGFSFGIQCTTCGGGLSDPVTGDIRFHVANAAIADLIAPNALGNVFAAAVGNLSTGATGPIGATQCTLECPTSAVPEPTTLLLLGTGLVAATTRLRRNRDTIGR